MLKTITKKQWIYFLFVIVALGITAQLIMRGPRDFDTSGIHYTHYNNYLIFKQSFVHLLEGKNLYTAYPAEHWDLFKYTPLFAMTMGVFYWMPDGLGLFLWNLLNVLVLFGGIYALPRLTLNQKFTIGLLVLLELVTSLQNAQSNALLVGLILYAFSFAEKGKTGWATVMVVLSVFIKLYGGIAFLLFLFYPKKWKAALFATMWTILAIALPLVIVGWQHNLFLFDEFLRMLKSDHDASYGLSVMGIIHAWFSIEIEKLVVLAIGCVLLLLPFTRWKSYSNEVFRMNALASLLLWMVIFNHKAESPTFIIAVVGMALCYVSFPLSTSWRIALLIGIAITSLAPTDLVPAFVRKEFVNPYVLKAVPSALLWLILTIKSQRHSGLVAS